MVTVTLFKLAFAIALINAVLSLAGWLVIVTTKIPLIDDVLTETALAVTVPSETAVNRPVRPIVAEPVPAMTDQVTDLSVALEGKTAAET